MRQGSPEAVLAAIAQSGNELTQGWMRLMAAAPAATEAPWMRGNPALQSSYLEKQVRLWEALLAGSSEEVVPEDPQDRRFRDPAWRSNPYYAYLKQSYLLAARYVEDAIEQAPLDAQAKARARFAAKQWIDALCPANFAATNPGALKQALQTQGESLMRGVANLLADVQRGRIRQCDETAFEVGRNVAVTPGAVVYENELMQLIQYAGATERVSARPLVMIPPCINKYYILDLQPEDSFVAYAVARRHTVFMVSWRNVGSEQAHCGWDDYLEQGVFAALRVAKEIAASDKVNALGFCVGGTLLGAGLAVLAEKQEDIVASATFLGAMLDFSDTGPIGFFVDEPAVAAREATIGGGGILHGAELAYVFSSVRANDLVWPYVVSNYLLGDSPAVFDLLFWNADSTNLPGPMFCYYVRNTYLSNKLREPGALVNCGVPVDLRKIRVPVFILGTREDHISPWRTVYRGLDLLGTEDKTFVLGAGGHITGVVNSPSRNRRSYWVNDVHPVEPDAWLALAEERKGSWWPLWDEWLSRHAGGTRGAPSACGSVKYPIVEAAPGRYVKHRIH